MRRLAGLLAAVSAVISLASTSALARRHHHGHHRTKHARKHKRAGTRPQHGQTKPYSGATGHGKPAQPINANQSNNWSGYNQGTLEQGSKLLNSIGGRWTVPTVSQHTAGQAEYSSDWIGIGGGCVDASCTATDSTLIQTGTEQDVSSSGTPSYSAWWEIIPGPSLVITNMTIHPGDKMSASITEAVPNSNVWTITLTDITTGQFYSTTVPYSSTHATAEWIQETPLLLDPSNPGLASEPNLTTPGFDLATTNGAPAGLKSSEAMNLINSSGTVISAPSAPDPDADGFNVCTWASTSTCRRPPRASSFGIAGPVTSSTWRGRCSFSARRDGARRPRARSTRRSAGSARSPPPRRRRWLR